MIANEFLCHLDCTDQDSWFARMGRIARGLHAPRDSGEYKFARAEVRRIAGSYTGSAGTSLVLALALLLAGMGARTPEQVATTAFLPAPEENDPIDPPPEDNTQKSFDDTAEEKVVEPVHTMSGDGWEGGENDPFVGISPSPDEGGGVVLSAPSSMTLENSAGIPADTLGRGKGGKGWGETMATAVARSKGDPKIALPTVLKALRWLKANQQADGSWEGANSPVAMTGLALLCYTAHGETPASEEFGGTVEKAIRYLVSAQDAGTGRFRGCGPNYVYGHAIATYALAEAYNLTEMVFLRDHVEKAARVIIDGQQAGGAFDYEYRKGARRDLSVTCWQVQALKAVKISMPSVEGLGAALEKSVDGVKGFASGGGKFGYDGPGDSEVLTGAAVLCLQMLGKGGDAAAVNGLNATANLQMSWPKGGGGTYGWYYHTQARFQEEGPLWAAWNKTMLDVLPRNQEADGHWFSNSTLGACPVYDTTLCCLSLEIYYRFLGTYKKEQVITSRAGDQGAREAEVKVQVTL